GRAAAGIRERRVRGAMEPPACNPAGAIEAPLLAVLAGLRHGLSTRAGGASEGPYAGLNAGLRPADAPALVAENRARMAARLAVAPERLLSRYQIHSPQVVTATEPWAAADRPRADALVTRTPGLAIGVATADCGPVLFADPDARVIGAAHA